MQQQRPKAARIKINIKKIQLATTRKGRYWGRGVEVTERCLGYLLESSTRTQWVSGKGAIRAKSPVDAQQGSPPLTLLLSSVSSSSLQPLALSTTPTSSRKPSSQQLLASRCKDSQPQLKSFGSDSKFSAQIRDWLSLGQVIPHLGSINMANPVGNLWPMMMGNSFPQGDNIGQREQQSSLACSGFRPPVQTQDSHPTSITEAKQMGTALFHAGLILLVCKKNKSLPIP